MIDDKYCTDRAALRRHIPVMKHWANGGEVEHRYLFTSVCWEAVDRPTWAWDYDYRVKESSNEA